MKTILAKAELDMEFDKEFCIDDLSRFLSALSLHENSSVDITSQRVVIQSDRAELVYACSDPAMIPCPPDTIRFPEPEVKFVLTHDKMRAMMKAMGVLGLSHVAITGKGGSLCLQAIEPDGKVKDFYSINIGKTNKEFRIIIKMENLKLLSSDYTVSVAQKKGKGIAKFTGIDFPVEYFIAVDSKSEFLRHEEREPAMG